VYRRQPESVVEHACLIGVNERTVLVV